MRWGELQTWLEQQGQQWKGVEDYEEGDMEIIGEAAGRLCYLSYGSPRPGGNAAYLEHIKEVGHGSVLEHAVFNFAVAGVSRSLTHELVRHRVGVGVSQLSQRYVDESQADYVIPSIVNADEDLKTIWAEAVQHAHAAYLKLFDAIQLKLHDRYAFGSWKFLPPHSTATDARKVARQAARSVLPNATETKLFFTVNARALRHILDMRATVHAEPEIRLLAVRLYLLAVGEAPNLFNDYTLSALPDGSHILTTSHKGV